MGNPVTALAALFVEARGRTTQAEAANLVGVDQPQWSRYESGDLLPSAKVVRAFARAFRKPQALKVWKEAKKVAAQNAIESALGSDR